MNIILSEYAGFCFGVKRAVDNVDELFSQGKKVATLGPLIHNPSYIEDFKNRGGAIINDVKEIDKNTHLVIRAHGITKESLS